MSGNVLEWVADFFDANYYSNGPSENPTGPLSSGDIDIRVTRSSSYNTGNDSRALTTTVRNGQTLTNPNSGLPNWSPELGSLRQNLCSTVD